MMAELVPSTAQVKIKEGFDSAFGRSNVFLESDEQEHASAGRIDVPIPVAPIVHPRDVLPD